MAAPSRRAPAQALDRPWYDGFMPVITLPDGSQKRFDQPVSVAQVAASIGAGLAKAALAGRVDGTLVDTSTILDHDATLSIVTDRDADGLEVIRHSTAHLLANAVQELFPDAQVTIGEAQFKLYLKFEPRPAEPQSPPPAS